ncbi:MAG: hypothetical protein RIR26_327 [Pseudomonadota bacterium]|jgi:hypothetical protein
MSFGAKTLKGVRVTLFFPRVISMKKIVFLLTSSSCLFAACTPEPARRSAAELSKMCPADKPVFAGSCLQTSAAAGPSLPAPPKEEPPTTEPPKEEPPKSEPPKEEPPKSEPPKQEPPKSEPPQQDSGGQSAANAQAEGIKILTTAIDQLTGKIKDGSLGGGQQPQSGQDSPDATVKNYVVKITADTFVAIADSVVVKNCFLPADSEIEVKGEPLKVTQFSSMGVEQYVASDVVSVTISGGAADSCGLKGKDFVYLSAHANATVKP